MIAMRDRVDTASEYFITNIVYRTLMKVTNNTIGITNDSMMLFYGKV